MFDFNSLYQSLATSRLSHWLEILPAQLASWNHNHQVDEQAKKWLDVVNHLPQPAVIDYDFLHNITAQAVPPLSTGQITGTEFLLQKLAPWKKGPFHLHNIHLDAEWRSDWKWQRLLPHIQPLNDRYVLDVGCGNGYHLWRILGAGAKQIVGIDPTLLFFCQFLAVRKLLGNDCRVHFVPVGIEQLPSLNAFDSVFSMGVLYHRRSPLDHLQQLKNQLISTGELILETLIVEGDDTTVLTPEKRYAQMKNVYFIPSALALVNWLKKVGFIKIKIADVNSTSLEEQRSTTWMPQHSLNDFLDPTDNSKTIEGYPAPKRAIVIATKP